ncbi:hypothetical protein D3C76_1874050 [compost metagenome]
MSSLFRELGRVLHLARRIALPLECEQDLVRDTVVHHCNEDDKSDRAKRLYESLVTESGLGLDI